MSCRYYGQRLTGADGDEQRVFVEQKTHRDKETGETSYKVRCVGQDLDSQHWTHARHSSAHPPVTLATCRQPH